MALWHSELAQRSASSWHSVSKVICSLASWWLRTSILLASMLCEWYRPANSIQAAMATDRRHTHTPPTMLFSLPGTNLATTGTVTASSLHGEKSEFAKTDKQPNHQKWGEFRCIIMRKSHTTPFPYVHEGSSPWCLRPVAWLHNRQVPRQDSTYLCWEGSHVLNTWYNLLHHAGGPENLWDQAIIIGFYGSQFATRQQHLVALQMAQALTECHYKSR